MIEAKKMSGIKNYEFIQVQGKNCLLGFGSYGSVQLGKDLITGQTVAIKKINRKIAFSEVEVHTKLIHPNIIKMLDYYLDQKNQCTYIILQYAENGTLFDFIRSNGLKDKQMARGIFLSVCDAIEYLHSKNVMHRDIKPENILLDKKNMVKLCDFGFAVNCETRMTVCGTAQYMSPEMILKKPYNHKIDIWGLGILFYEMIEGRAPFEGQTQEQVFEKIKKPIQFSKKFSIQEIQIIKSILKINPQQRPEIQQIINSVNFKQIKICQQQSKRSTTDSQEEKKIKIVEIKEIQKEKNIQNPQKKIKIVQIKELHQSSNQKPTQKYEKSSSTLTSNFQESKIPQPTQHPQISKIKSEKVPVGFLAANQKISLKKPMKKI